MDFLLKTWSTFVFVLFIDFDKERPRRPEQSNKNGRVLRQTGHRISWPSSDANEPLSELKWAHFSPSLCWRLMLGQYSANKLYLLGSKWCCNIKEVKSNYEGIRSSEYILHPLQFYRHGSLDVCYLIASGNKHFICKPFVKWRSCMEMIVVYLSCKHLMCICSFLYIRSWV